LGWMEYYGKQKGEEEREQLKWKQDRGDHQPISITQVQVQCSEASTLLTKEENEASTAADVTAAAAQTPTATPGHGMSMSSVQSAQTLRQLVNYPTDCRLRRRHLVVAKEAQQEEGSTAADDHQRYGGDVPCHRRPVRGYGAGRGEEDGSRAAEGAACCVHAGDLRSALHPKTIGCRQCKIVSFEALRV